MANKLLQKVVTYFVPRRIVYASGYPSGILVKASELRGKKFLTIAVTNVAINQVQNQAIIYHVPVAKVIGIKQATTPFQRWWYDKVLLKPLPNYQIKKLKKS